jgi:hypothetical protein
MTTQNLRQQGMRAEEMALRWRVAEVRVLRSGSRTLASRWSDLSKRGCRNPCRLVFGARMRGCRCRDPAVSHRAREGSSHIIGDEI